MIRRMPRRETTWSGSDHAGARTALGRLPARKPLRLAAIVLATMLLLAFPAALALAAVVGDSNGPLCNESRSACCAMATAGDPSPVTCTDFAP